MPVVPCGMRFAICNEIFKEWEWDRACRYARDAGYEALEIAPFTFGPLVTGIDPARRREIRRTAESAGVAISGIHWVLAYTEGFHVNHPDPAVRERASEYLVAAVDFCADLGGGSLIFGSPKRRDVLDGVSLPQAIVWTRETFAQAIRTAERRGVVICMEPLAPSETNFLNTADDAWALVEPVASSAFRIMLDVKAMASEGRPIAETIRSQRGRFAYFHANDVNLKGPGFGDVDFVPIAAALREVGYDGTVSVEVFQFEEGPEAIASRSREYLRRTFGC
ncbi:MAG: sugar phosphate isomerase/epimerase [Verrucomicrobiae bacterium]|nr:sugar phosphate isomerase/epimerase [Verrucomicrobiae bacterium]